MGIFSYEKPKVPDDCVFIISPSSISKFFEYPSVWYEEQYKKISSLKPTTATLTGTICHHIYECVTSGEEVSREEINKELDELIERDKLDVNVDKIKNDYPLVASEVVNNYLLPANRSTHNIKSEFPVVAHVKDGVYIAGTCDRLEGDCVVDFKTVSTKPSESELPFGYKIQLLAYAYALRNTRHEVNRIRIVYGVKPTKTLGARCFSVTESIDFQAEQLIKDTLTLIADTITTIKNKPELTYLLFKSMKLKENV